MLTRIKRLLAKLRGVEYLNEKSYDELDRAIYGDHEEKFASLTQYETLEAMREIKRR